MVQSEQSYVVFMVCDKLLDIGLAKTILSTHLPWQNSSVLQMWVLCWHVILYSYMKLFINIGGLRRHDKVAAVVNCAVSVSGSMAWTSD